MLKLMKFHYGCFYHRCKLQGRAILGQSSPDSIRHLLVRLELSCIFRKCSAVRCCKPSGRDINLGQSTMSSL